MTNDSVASYDSRSKMVFLMILRAIFMYKNLSDCFIQISSCTIKLPRTCHTVCRGLYLRTRVRMYFNVWVYGTYREITCARLHILKSSCILHCHFHDPTSQFDVFLSRLSLRINSNGSKYIKFLFNEVEDRPLQIIRIFYITSSSIE